MTVASTTSRASYPGAGSTGPFAYPYRIFVETDLKVTKKNVAGVETTLLWPADFTVTGVLSASGTITLTTALLAGETLTIRRKPANTQPTSIRNQGTYFPATIEDEFDRLDMQIIALQDLVDRSFGFSETTDPATVSTRIPPGVTGQVLGWANPSTLTNISLSGGAIGLPGQGRTVTTLTQYLANNALYNVLDYAPVGVVINTGLNDATSAIVATVAAAAVAGGIVFFPPGFYKTTATIYVPRWVHIVGCGMYGPGMTYDGISVIYGVHTQAAILSYKGTFGSRLEDILLHGDPVSTPKTGLCLGRNLGLGSAGNHSFRNVNVDGYYSQAAVYQIASEENIMVNLNIYLRGGGALFPLYIAQGDSLAVDSLGSSSHLNCSWYGLRVSSEVANDNAACIMIFAGAGTGDLNFFGGYLLPARGAYVSVNVNQDGASMVRGLYFYGMSGEINPASTGPIYGYRFQSAGAFAAITVIDGSFFPTAVGGFFLKMEATGRLIDSRIKTPLGNNPSSYALSQFTRSDIDLGSGRYSMEDIIMGLTSKFGVSSDNTSGIFWGDPGNLAVSPQMRLQSAATQLQLLLNGAFYDMAMKDLWLGGVVPVKQGAGSPAGVVTAPVGSLYLRNDGGAVTTLYIKESGTGNAGWVAK